MAAARQRRNRAPADWESKEREFQGILASGNHYDALQGYQSLGRRLLACGDTRNARELLSRGSAALLCNGRQDEAAELLLQLLPSCGTLEELGSTMSSLLTPYLGQEPFSATLEHAIQSALTHSVTLYQAEHPAADSGPASRLQYPGLPLFHSMLALLALRRRNIAKASEHFIRSDRIAQFAQLSVSWLTSNVSHSNDDGLFLRKNKHTLYYWVIFLLIFLLILLLLFYR